MFKHIVCATDFSEPADVAARYAASIARTFHGEVELVHGWHWLEEMSEFALLRPEAIEESLKVHDARLAKAVDDLLAHGIQASGKRVDGPLDRAIGAHVAEVHADLLVVGTEGRTGMAHALLGSVAERIVRTSPVPVLVVPHATDVAREAHFAPKHILVPVDLAPESGEVLRTALSLARHTGAKLTVVHAWQSLLMPPHGEAESHTEDEMDARFGEWLKEQIGDASVEHVVDRAAPYDLIERVALERKPDLVVMSTAGRTGVMHFMIGSVTERTVRGLGLPVLTVRRPSASESAA
jgi:nucleotide-binding universal stress UspA family protein